ncbi:MAG: ABC transporter ATP-binding protein [Oscillospiraceae bacterium]|jgi:ABC-2 type transport system ATP-binding protein|nr:ABC transporter ATP-binding protein [Oscillospiraceae bacterium]
MSVIKVDHLTKDYGSGRGVFDVSFHVDAGEVFGFLGPNGAGKSTTIRHLMGFSKPDSGKTMIFDTETFGRYDRILSRVGYIPGENALPAGLTGWEFLHMMQQMQGQKNEALLKTLIDRFELDPSGDTKRMSLGVKRKLAVVTAFMNDPEVLILDEPTSGLDPVMQESFIDYVRTEKKRGKTILLSSHIFSEVDATCDRIAIIKDGKIVSDFVADDLRHAEQKQYFITFADEAGLSKFCDVCRADGSVVLISSEPEKKSAMVSVNDRHINDFIRLLSGCHVTAFEHRKETLEDYFMSYYKEEKSFGGVFAK